MRHRQIPIGASFNTSGIVSPTGLVGRDSPAEMVGGIQLWYHRLLKEQCRSSSEQFIALFKGCHVSQGEREQASRIVRDIWEGGIRSTSFEDPRTPEFAKAALSELVALLEKGVPGLLQEALEGADLSANQLAVDDTHGLMELVQNADDQRASRLRFGMRSKSSRRELLAAHDGDPITVSDIAAMCVAFVSTKRDDPGMDG